MKKHLIIILFLIIHMVDFKAQSVSRKKNEVDKIIAEIIQTVIEEGRKILPVYKYAGDKKVIKADINGDNKDDLVVNVNLQSEKIIRDPLLQFFVVMINGDAGYVNCKVKPFVGYRNFAGYLSRIQLENVKDGKVYLKARRWGLNDPDCCPSIVENYYFQIDNVSLVFNEEIQKYIELSDKIGTVVNLGHFQYRVDDVEFKKQVGGQYLNAQADGVYLIVYLTIINQSRETRTIANGMFKIYSSDGIEYGSASNVAAVLVTENKNPIVFENLPPRIPKKFVVAFEVPNSYDNYKLKVWGGWGSDEYKEISLRR